MLEQFAKTEKVKVLTLGCRLNQYESQSMLEDLSSHGYVPTKEDERADIYLINTCTVTHESDKKSRYLIRRCHHENPNAKIVVTGCYVEKDQDAVRSLPGVTHVVLNRDKAEISRIIQSCTEFSLQHISRPIRTKTDYTPLRVSAFAGHTRAHVKIQDGCNHACSFCKVVLVRGKSRSRPFHEISDEVKRLVQNGYREVVLTGIQLGAYGLDFNTKTVLADVLNELKEIADLRHIRLSSIEPIDVTQELINALQVNSKACHHLHIPLQSGSDVVLRAMNRRYNRRFFIDLIAELYRKLPNFVLTTDVMVGFPGETDEDFLQTVDLLKTVSPLKLHIFPYSSRTGTRAARLSALQKSILRQRETELRGLEDELRLSVQERFVGKRLTGIVENKSEIPNTFECRMSNYLSVFIPSSFNLRFSECYPIMISRMKDNRLWGEPIQTNTEETSHEPCAIDRHV